MTNDKKDNIIMLNGGKTDETEDIAELSVNDNLYEWRSFIISGETSDGKRLAFTWNASLDNVLIYNAVLALAVQDRVREAFESNKTKR